jgi:hypothetical protein
MFDVPERRAAQPHPVDEGRWDESWSIGPPHGP